MKPVYVDIHIHTSENPNVPDDNYNVDKLIEKVKGIAQENSVILSLTDHNMINKKAYISLCQKIDNVILGVELHIKKYDDAQPYHCHILFNEKITENIIDNINDILDELYEDKIVTNDTDNVPNIETIANSFDNYEYILLPHGGQSHRTFDKATGKGHRFDTSMENSIYYNHFEGFTARSNKGLKETIDYFKRLGIDQFTNLITCSDNYNPNVYPNAKSKEAEDFVPTWIFSQPTFDGLRLALSESSRIYYGFEAPERWSKSLYGVTLKENNCDIDVNLMPGLNVVIGGSSSGKTLFVDSVVRGISKKFEGSEYIKFGVENIDIVNPSKIVPHYINQNFIITILKDEIIDLGKIDIINEVFPEEDSVIAQIRQNLKLLKELVEQLVDAVKDYEQYQKQLTHISNPGYLIIGKDTPKRIASLIKPNAENRNRFSLSNLDLENYLEILDEIRSVFKKSKLDLKYNEEIENIKIGLKYIFNLSQLSEELISLIESFDEREVEEIADEDRENSQKIEQRKKLISCLAGALIALDSFYDARNKLCSFDYNVTTKEIEVNGHKLSIENSFELTKEVLKEVVNKYIKVNKRIESFDKLEPENIYEEGFSNRPKVNGYSDFANKIYQDISNKNVKTYKIVTSEGKKFEDLSPGWKSAVLLDLILGFKSDSAPLIIDQPEDNLATDYINHGLVEQIKNIKPNKQIILVSHNATIPMLGDAQNVIVCINDNQKIVIRSAALESQIDGKRVLDLVADITDGGKPSIRKRVKKYDLKKYKET